MIIKPPILGKTDPPEFVAYEETMLREPRLLVPGMQPLGPVKINYNALNKDNLINGLVDIIIPTSSKTLKNNLSVNWGQKFIGIRGINSSSTYVTFTDYLANSLRTGTIFSFGVANSIGSAWSTTLKFGYSITFPTNLEEVFIGETGNPTSTTMVYSIRHNSDAVTEISVSSLTATPNYELGAYLSWIGNTASPSAKWCLGPSSGTMSTQDVFPWDINNSRTLYTGGRFRPYIIMIWDRDVTSFYSKWLMDPFSYLIPA
jgi:hypothetical protein